MLSNVVTTKVIVPIFDDLGAALDDDFHCRCQLRLIQSCGAAWFQRNFWFQPEFSPARLARDVYVLWLVTFVAIEEESKAVLIEAVGHKWRNCI